MTANGEKLGILVGGGPAPGINSVISSVTIEAINSGFEVLGIVDGFQHLIAGSTEHVHPLTISDVSRIHFQGGSVLRTSRANPTRSEEHLEQVGKTLGELGVTRLVTIGATTPPSARPRWHACPTTRCASSTSPRQSTTTCPCLAACPPSASRPPGRSARRSCST